MSLTSTAPITLPPHAIDRPHQSSMSHTPTDARNHQDYYGRLAPGSAHGAPHLEASSPDRLNSAGGATSFPKAAPPPPSPLQIFPSPQAAIGPTPGSAHPNPQQTPVTPMSGSAYPPQSPAPYYTMTPQTTEPPLPTPPAPAGAAAPPGRTTFAPDGAPIVPVGISGGKMFRCRGFGDCDKVFTRSEHLARHVRKHTGERPFPCHCGKAFSRLDNLRQHAATVHADSTQLNEAMLSSLATVHAALSQRANREQRRRGEVVEVPKNAVERPRGERGVKGAPGTAVPPPGTVYPPAPGYHHPQQWGAPPDHGRPRTAGSWVEYPYGTVGAVGEHPAPPGTAGSVAYSDDAGPSRRPPSAGYPGGYYEQGPPSSSHGRPGTAPVPPGTASSDDSGAVPYYRPISSNGPGHYPDSEPPTSAHGPPPHSPMYPHPPGTVPTPGNWTSPPTPHTGYPTDTSLYPTATVPPAEGHHPYPPGQGPEGHYGPPPPGSAGGYYQYPPQGHGYYGQQPSPAQQHPPTFPPAPGVAPAVTSTPTSAYPPHYGGPPESPFQYNTPAGSYPYGPGYDARKRRAEDEAGGDRKHPRSADGGPASAEPRAPGAPGDQLWLPPASERRSSLAISALLGSPQQDTHTRARAGGADVANPEAYPYTGAPYDDRAARERPAGPPDEKPKALVAE